jgi:hypothetical protein
MDSTGYASQRTAPPVNTMKLTLANQQKWSGFHCTAYSLNSKVLDLPLTQRRRVDGATENIPTTVGEVYKRLADRRIEVEEAILEIEITTETEKLVFAGPAFILRMLEELLGLRNDGANPFSATWYLYDSEFSTDQPHDLYTFFVVCDDKIVREHVCLRDYPGNGFDPSLFEAEDYSFFNRSSEAAWRRALTQFWYRKFYTETQMGQLAALRDPKVSGRWDFDTTARLLRKIYVLLCVLIVLISLMIIRLSR